LKARTSCGTLVEVCPQAPDDTKHPIKINKQRFMAKSPEWRFRRWRSRSGPDSIVVTEWAARGRSLFIWINVIA
jgi:hypothetical protein